MRLLLEGIKIAIHVLLTNKLRTFLTLLGNIVGITSVIAVVSLLGGIDNYMRQEVASEGSNVFAIERMNFFDVITDFDRFLDAIRHNPRLEKSDVEYLRSRLTNATYVSGKVSTSGRVGVFDKYVDGIRVRGQDAFYPFVENISLEMGRHFTTLEERESKQVVVIGWEVYERLLMPRNPIGQVIKIRNRHFRVIGVVEDRASLLGQNQNRFAVIPLGAYRKLYGANESLRIEIATSDIAMMDPAIEEARVAMRIRHHLRPGKDDDFFVSTSQQLIDLWKKISQGIMIALVALVSIAMVVGGIVLMNTMLVSVTERTREIGLRKAVGARRLTIVWQFLVESAMLSVFGGAMGMAIGFAVAAIVSVFSVLPYVVTPVVVAIAFAVTLLLGLIFGTYPAVRASRLDPVEALRSE